MKIAAMFIPRGEPLYENLATSFVSVDALVEDLCEGGFTGIVEITLREADCIIVIAGARVLSAVESKPEAPITLTSSAEIAAKSKAERGRVSVYKLSGASAEAIAKRAASEPLYSALSTEFADPEKMVSKLKREHAREWFIEITAETGLQGLVHIKDGSVHGVTSGRDVEEGEQSVTRLIEESKASGGSFDVFHSILGKAAIPRTAAVAPAPTPEPAASVPPAAPAVSAPAVVTPTAQPAVAGSEEFFL
ncbi:MAG TPA: hypothetical protein VLZ81_04585, partial [Blastocatellia bacterium]|nr:hypothetical protein [Blastocatellia bacterium]